MAATVLFERETAEFTLKLARYAASTVMPAHAHDDNGVSIVLEGTLVEEANHASFYAGPGWSVIKPASTIHANAFGAAGATLLAIVPRLASSRFPTTWSWIERPSVFRSALRLVTERSDGIYTEFIAALEQEKPGGLDHQWLRKVRASLDDVSQPLRPVSALASEANVHPVYLARRFRGAYGMSLREYRLVVQVRRATQLVLGTRRTLSEIAHACGFADHSHMCRSFRVVARTTPGALRASH